MTTHHSHHRRAHAISRDVAYGAAGVALIVLFLATAIFTSGRSEPFASSEMRFTDASRTGLQIVPASGASAPVTPTVNPVQCNPDGTATLSWNPTPGTERYPVRYNNSPIACPTTPGWFSARPGECDNDWVGGSQGYTPGTSITVPIVYNNAYYWWVHSYFGGMWSTSAGGPFNCPTPGPAPTCTLSYTPTTMYPGDTTLAQWTSTNATGRTHVVYRDGVYYGGPYETGSVSGSYTITYAEVAGLTGYIQRYDTVTGSGGSGTCSAAVTVVPPGPPSCTLSVVPNTVNQPSAATLSWNSTQASTFLITNVSYVTPNQGGSTSVAPAQTTVYTGTVTSNAGYGSAQCTATLNVNRSCTFNGNTVTHGNSVTAYQAATVPYGSSCVSQTRTCTDSSLSGTYTFASCTPAGAPDFQITVTDIAMGTPAQLAAASAQPATIRKRIDATLISGSSATVNFTASGVPAGVTYDFSPASCSMSCSSTLTINVSANAPTGNHTVTVTGTSGSAVRTSQFNLFNACQPTYECVGNTIRHTNAACVISDILPSCAAPSFCSPGSSQCLTNPVVFIRHLEVSPQIVASGATAKLYWDVDNVTACTVTENNPTIADTFTGAASGAGGRTTSAITQQTTYTLQCTAEDGTPFTPESKTILVAPSFQEQ